MSVKRILWAKNFATQVAGEGTGFICPMHHRNVGPEGISRPAIKIITYDI